jgi:hypothetical protein
MKTGSRPLHTRKQWHILSPIKLTTSFALIVLLLAGTTAALPGATWLFPTHTAYAAGPWYVDAAIDDDTGLDCKSDLTPCKTIGAVLNKTDFADGNTINVAAGTYTYTETLTLAKSAVIVGAGKTSTIFDGQATNRIFDIQSGVSLSISGVTIKNGKADNGGAIRNAGDLTIEQSILTTNEATAKGGAIYNTGKLLLSTSTITNSVAATDGGAIANDNAAGQVTIEQSTLANNEAKQGGAISNIGYVSLLNATISGNTATHGGGLINFGKLMMHSTTIAFNQATRGGGLYNENAIYGSPYSSETVTSKNTLLASNTASDSGPNCWTDEDINSRGYNLIDNTSGCPGFSAVDGPNDLVGTSINPVNPNLKPLAHNGGDTWTHEVGYSDTNTPVDAGSCTDGGDSQDQRGVARPNNDSLIDNIDDGCDIGAYEVTPPRAIDDAAATPQGTAVIINVLENDEHPDPVLETTDIDASTVQIFDPNNSKYSTGPVDLNKGTAEVNADGTITYTPFNVSQTGDDTFTYIVKDSRGWASNEANVTVELEIPCTTNELIAAIEEANTDSNRDTIFVSSACSYELTAVYDTAAPKGNAGLPDIETPITLKTINNTPVTINRADSASTNFRIFNIVEGGELELVNLDLTNGQAASGQHGGAIYSTGILTLTGTTANDNQAVNGGAVYVENNSDTEVAIKRYTSGDNRRSSLNGNIATGEGGAIFNAGGPLTINRGDINDNQAQGGNGGAIANTGGALEIKNSDVKSNWASGNGGGIYDTSSDDLTIQNVNIEENGYQDTTTKTVDGGGIYNTNSKLTLTDSSVENNRATGNGGGVYSTGEAEIKDNDIRFNGKNADNDPESANGGGIYHESSQKLYIRNNRINENQTKGNGGGIYNTSHNAEIRLGDTIKNIAEGNGGGFYNDSGSETANLLLTDTTLQENQAEQGGGVYSTGTSSKMTIRYTSIADNLSDGDGANVYLASGTIDFDRITVSGGASQANGGGVYLGAGTLTIDTSTISTNSANEASGNGGGFYIASGSTVDIKNSTVTSNTASSGQGVYNLGTFEPFSSIIAGNPVGGSSDCAGTGTFTSQGFNLAHSSCNLGGTHDIDSGTANDPRLGPLADNGGWRNTHMLIAGSPALDVGSCNGAAAGSEEDQRRQPRPITPKNFSGTLPDDGCDVGSVEGVLIIVNTNQDGEDKDTTDSTCELEGNSDLCTLRSAITVANNYESTDNISFNIPGDGPHTIAVDTSLGVMKIEEPTILSGDSQPDAKCVNDSPELHELQIILDGQGMGTNDHGLHVTSGDSIIRGLKIQNFSGSGIYLESGDDNSVWCNHITNNGHSGVLIQGSSYNRIGERWQENRKRNVISSNGENGVTIISGSHNTIRTNDIHSNGKLGIDLGNDGITPNDPSDPDDGPNELQNFPQLTSKPTMDADGNITGWGGTIEGVLYSTPKMNFNIDLYTNDTCDEWNGEGQSYRRSHRIYIGDSGRSDFEFDYEPMNETEQEAFLSFTATDENFNTSEFSFCSMFNSSISGKVWIDANRDGLQGDTEAPVADVNVHLYNDQGRLEQSTKTAADGTYTFEYLGVGSYYLKVDRPAGLKFTDSNQGDDDTLDSDIDPVTGKSATISLPNSTDEANWDIGLKATGITLTESDGSTDVTEGLSTDTYTLRLNGQPTHTVELKITTDGQTTVDPTEWTFTPENWDTEAKVTVTAVDDDIDETPTHIGVITNEFTSVDPDYNETILVNANITDNDGVGVSVNPTELHIYEGGEPGVFELSLTEAPSEDVVIGFDTDTQVKTIPSITFTPTNWDTVKPVKVEALKDGVIEGEHTSVIRPIASSADPRYNGITITRVLAKIDDGLVTIEPLELEVTEGSGEATYQVYLTEKPTSTVTVNLQPDAQVQVSQSTLTFDETNYDSPRTITVEAVDDAIIEPQHIGMIDHSSTQAGGGIYQGLNLPSVEVTINDNDNAGIGVSLKELSVSEEGPTRATYEVWLHSKPAPGTTVIIKITTPDGQTQIYPKDQLLFDQDNWDTRTEVEVEAIDDAKIEGIHTGRVKHEVSSGDPDYDSFFMNDIIVNILDNDVPNIEVSPTSFKVSEEGETSGEYQVNIGLEPDTDVTVTLSSTNQVTITPKTLTFKKDGDAWKTAKTVNVQAIDDTLIEGPHEVKIEHFATTPGGSGTYEGVDIEDVRVHIVDNEVKGVDTYPNALELAENAKTPVEYEIQLTKRPSNTVVVNVHTDGSTKVNTATVTIPPDEWKSPKIVKVMPVDDLIAQPSPKYTSKITHTVSSSDAEYEGVDVPDITVTILDNEKAGVEITPTSVDVAEDGTGVSKATYEVRLTSQPIQDVVVHFSSLEGQVDILTSEPGHTVTFSATDWVSTTFRTITVKAKDDLTAEGMHQDTIRHHTESTDPNYAKDQFAIDDVTVNIDDNDTPGIVFTPKELTTAEGGAAVEYTVKLTTKPKNNVIVKVSSDNSQVEIKPATLVFTATDWTSDTVKTVKVKAIEDGVIEGDHSVLIKHTSTSGDPAYGKDKEFVLDDVKVRILDSPGLILSKQTLDVAEGGNGKEYTIRLTTKPSAPVSVTLKLDPQVTSIPTATVVQAFDETNWNSERTIRIKAVDDKMVEGAHSSIVEHFYTSDDPRYNDGGFPSLLNVNITDNDTPNVDIQIPDGGLTVSEEGITAKYQVRLTAKPKAGTEVTVLFETGAQVEVVPVKKVFDSTNWDVYQDITISAVDDKVAEGGHKGFVKHSVTSNDKAWDKLETWTDINDVEVTVEDNDTPGVTIDLPDDFSVSEDGATAEYTIKLNTKPANEVTITPKPKNGQVTVVPAYVTFDATNWESPQTIQVTAVDDDIFERAHKGTIEHTIASTDPNYDGSLFFIDDAVVDISDNDSPGVIVRLEDSEAAEDPNDGNKASYHVKLTGPPQAEVTLNFGLDSQVKVIPSTITFDATSWDTEKTVTVQAIDDDVAEGDHKSTISHWTESTDAEYSKDAFYIDDVLITIKDDDSAGVVLNKTVVEVDEDGTLKAEYTVKLTSEPKGDEVTITIQSNDAQVKIIPASKSLTFDKTNWSVPRTVQVTAVDDELFERDHTATIKHTITSTGDDYDATLVAIDSVQANIKDNDSPGVTIEPLSGISVSEDGTKGEYTIKLTDAPIADVKITISTNGGQVKTIPPDVTFTTENWDTPKVIQISAIDDDIVEGKHNATLKHTISSTDPAYSPSMIIMDQVTVDIDDNDSAGVTITPLTVEASEDGTKKGEYSIKLTSQPSATVTIKTTTGDGQTKTVPPSVSFDATNWDTAKTITVIAIDDDKAERSPHTGIINHSVESTDVNYQPDMFTIDEVTVDIDDNDAPGIMINPTEVEVSEDGVKATYDVMLASQPAAEVKVTMTPGTQTTVTPPFLTFDATNWDTARSITVQAIDDAVAEERHRGIISHATESDDANYKPDEFIISDVHVRIDDNDSAGVTINPLEVDTSEDGATATYEVMLTSQPTETVKITVYGNKQAEVEPALLRFDSTNWDTARTVNVSAIDDLLIEGSHSTRITHTIASTVPSYNGDRFVIDDVQANIEDNDSAGATVVPINVDVAEGGATDVYSITLTNPPSATVNIFVGGGKQTTVSPAKLEFGPTSWNVGQEVMVSAIDDNIVEGKHTGVISHTNTSSDPNYATDMFFIDDVQATVADNDSAGVIISPKELYIAEGGPTNVVSGTKSYSSTAIYSVTLTTIPTAPVKIDIAGNAKQVSVSPATLTFTDDTPQEVAVTVVDDAINEGDHSTTITHTISSDDFNYSETMLAVDDVKVNILDNDGAGFVLVEPTKLSVSEEGPTSASYEVSLEGAPAKGVSVFVDVEPKQLKVTPSIVEFTPTDWETPRTVEVTAIDDDVVETRPHSTTITHRVLSLDEAYQGTDVAPVVVSIQDNDVALPTQSTIFLPIISHGGEPAKPDLSVEFVQPSKDSFTSDEAVEIELRITNNSDIDSYREFYVDFYVDPSSLPTSANTPWNEVSEHGITWFYNGNIKPGSSITIKSTDQYVLAGNTDWPGSFPAGTTRIYAYVDSWNRDDDAGNRDPRGRVFETDETNNSALKEITVN